MPLVKRADKINETGIGEARLCPRKGREAKARRNERRTRKSRGRAGTEEEEGCRGEGCSDGGKKESQRPGIISEIIFHGCFDEINRPGAASRG